MITSHFSPSFILIILIFPRFFTRTQRFMDAYRRGLGGKQAAWASKKYRGHRVLPEKILEELDAEGITRE